MTEDLKVGDKVRYIDRGYFPALAKYHGQIFRIGLLGNDALIWPVREGEVDEFHCDDDFSSKYDFLIVGFESLEKI